MERYSTYKPSVVPGQKEIPAHWKEILNGILFKENVRKPKEDDIPLSLSQKDGLIPTELMKESSLKTSSYDNWKRVVKHDLVLNRFKAHLGVLMASDYEGMVSFHYGVYEPRMPLVTKYYELLYHTDVYKGIYAYTSNGMTVGLQNLSNLAFYSIKGIYPPLAEQEKIVSYLESKTSKIDAYVADKEKEIQLLQELKQKTIAEAVTKGLNPNVKMKDSGISWLGMIPEHWEIKKIGSLFSERREKVSDKDYPALSVSKQGITPQLETAVKTDNGDNRKKVCKDDFVVNSRSDRKGSCGVSPYTGSVSLINIVLSPRKNIEVQYFHHLFRSNDYIEEYYRIGRGIVADLWTTRYSEMRNIMVPLPPLDEQRAIVSYIEDKCQKIDTLTMELQAEIDYLKEYKQRLIADVVTGQVNVAQSESKGNLFTLPSQSNVNEVSVQNEI